VREALALLSDHAEDPGRIEFGEVGMPALDKRKPANDVPDQPFGRGFLLGW